MFYYKKLIDGFYQYHACSKAPLDMTGFIEITQEEYDNFLKELFIALDANDSENPQETQD